MKTTLTTHRSLLGGACCALALVVALSACGPVGKKGGSSSGSGSVPKASPSPVRGKMATTQIGKAFWFGRFKVTIVSGALGIPADQPLYDTKPRLQLALTMENLGDDAHQFRPELSINEGGQNYTEVQWDTQPVPGKQRGDGTVTFTVEDAFSLSDAELTVGNAHGQQAKVPLGKSGDYVSLEPRSVPVSGSVSAGSMTVNVTGGTLDAAKDYYTQADAGHLIMILTYSATRTKDSGQSYVNGSDFFLKLPDGTAVTALDGDSSGSLAAGTTKQDLVVRFDVKQPADGAYDLVFKGGYNNSFTDVQGDLKFTVSPDATGGSNATPSAGTDYFSPAPQASPSGH
jgi:hypothetical protein